MPEQRENRLLIEDWILENAVRGSRVLDIGCGEGDLLARLVQEKDVKGTGIELCEDCVVKAVQKGLSVHHGNVEEGLDHYSDNHFDLVILSLTVQEVGNPVHVLEEAFRVGRQALVVFPNFGFWHARWQLVVEGRAPRTHSYPYNWNESPNRHFFTVLDWEDFCSRHNWQMTRKAFVSKGRFVHFWPNLFSEVALYIIRP